MPYMLHRLAFILIFSASIRSVIALPGANVPWITYDYAAGNMTNGGGATNIGPPAQVANVNVGITDTIQMEASGGQAVELNGTGQYVGLTAQSNANQSWCAIVCRTRRLEVEPIIPLASTLTESLFKNFR